MSGVASPRWELLGLTHNPFENQRSGERPDWVSVPAAVEAAVAQRPFAVEVIGEKGAGKSSILRALAARLGGQYCYLDGLRRLEALVPEPSSVWCLDEANNAPKGWVKEVGKAAQRAQASLLFGTHWSLKPQVPWLRTLHLAEHAAPDWVERRVASAQVAGRQAFDFAALGRELGQRVKVTYAVQRVLYELAENLARGFALPDALDDAIERASADPTVGPWLGPVRRTSTGPVHRG